MGQGDFFISVTYIISKANLSYSAISALAHCWKMSGFTQHKTLNSQNNTEVVYDNECFVYCMLMCMFQASCVWLLAVVKECGHVTVVQEKLKNIQLTFMRLLSEPDGKYENGNERILWSLYYLPCSFIDPNKFIL